MSTQRKSSTSHVHTAREYPLPLITVTDLSEQAENDAVMAHIGIAVFSLSPQIISFYNKIHNEGTNILQDISLAIFNSFFKCPFFS
jgi:hypothetical protein